MKVYGSARWRSFRVIWCLEKLGLPYDIVYVRPRSPGIRAVNPMGQVPALDDNGTIVTDSTAILHYLSDKENRLTFPPGTAERARLDAAVVLLLTEVEAPLWMAARHSYVLPEERRRADFKPSLRQDFVDALDRWGLFLSDGPYLCGDTFTIADILAGHLADWAMAARFEIDNAAVGAYVERLRSRPAYEAARATGDF